MRVGVPCRGVCADPRLYLIFEAAIPRLSARCVETVRSPRHTGGVEDYLDRVISGVRRWDDARMRSQQRDVGVSDLVGCRSELGFILRGDEPSDDRDNWRAVAGTALHSWLSNLRLYETAETGEKASFEMEVSYRSLTGHVDEVNFSRGEVTDYKFPSKRSALVWDDPDVQAERFVQVHVYGAAVRQTDMWKALAPNPDEMLVRMLIAPVDGTFSDWVSYEMPLDIETADEAIDRYEEVKSLVAANMDLPRDKPWFWCSRYCDFFTACRGGGYGPAIVYPEITDEEVAAMVERYGQAVGQARQADQVKKALAPQLAGVRGSARGGNVQMGRAGSDRGGPGVDAIAETFPPRNETVPLMKKEGRAAYVIVHREEK